jgi:hypothetical protein
MEALKGEGQANERFTMCVVGLVNRRPVLYSSSMLFGKLSPRLLGYSTEAVFKEKRGVWDSMLELTIYLIVAPEVQLSTPTAKGKRRGGEGLFYWLGTSLDVC